MSRSRISPVFAALAGAAVLFWGQSANAASAPRPPATSVRPSSPHSVSRAPSGRSGSSHHDSGGHWSGRSGGHHSGGHYYGGRYYGGYGWYPRFGWGYYGDWGWGWGWGFGPWYPYGYWGAYGYPYGYGYGYRQGYAASRYAVVKTDVEPDEAALYLDGKLIGTADDFDGYPDTLYLGTGHYRLEFRLDGYESYTTDVDASPGRFFRIDHHLKKIPGAKHYGTYEPARPEGGIVRYFEKRRRHRDDGPPASSWRDRQRRDRQEAIVEPDVPAGPDEAAPPDDDWDEGPPPASEEDRPYSEQPVTSQPAPPEPAPSAVPAGEARIVFDVFPPDAAVYVDDHFAGSARELDGLPEGLSVTAGEHRITVTCPGYREATMRVTASASTHGRARLSLKR